MYRRRNIGFDPNAVGAFDYMEVYPNSHNIIAERMIFTLDICSSEREVLDTIRCADTTRTSPQYVILDVSYTRSRGGVAI